MVGRRGADHDGDGAGVIRLHGIALLPSAKRTDSSALAGPVTRAQITSCPDLFRASTSLRRLARHARLVPHVAMPQDVDARNKSGHDEGEADGKPEIAKNDLKEEIILDSGHVRGHISHSGEVGVAEVAWGGTGGESEGRKNLVKSVTSDLFALNEHFLLDTGRVSGYICQSREVGAPEVSAPLSIAGQPSRSAKSALFAWPPSPGPSRKREGGR